MMICYTPEGRVELLVSDPLPEGLVELYEQRGKAVILVGEAPENFFLDHYVDPVTKTLTPRPIIAGATSAAIAADDTDTFTLSDLPQPCTVTVDGAPFNVADGTFEFTTPMAATYVIDIDHWPYMPFRTEVTAE